MKKIVYTSSLLVLFAISGKAQSETKQQEPTKAAQEPQAKPAPAQKAEKAPAAAQPSSSGTRMAINEKGVPASKATATKEKKEDKPASPGQPVVAPEKH